jgi:hypothetical protein
MATLLGVLERELSPPSRARWIAYVLAALLAIGAIALVVQWRRARDARPSAPAPNIASIPGDASPAARTTKIESTSIRAMFTLSPGGLLAIGTERIQVKDLVHPERPAKVLAAPDIPLPWTDRIQFDGESALYWSMAWGADVVHWRFGDAQPAIDAREDFGGERWLGKLADGDLIAAYEGVDHTRLDILDKQRQRRTIMELESGRALELLSITPNRERFAVTDASDAFHSRIVVVEPRTGRQWRSESRVGITALSWRDNDRLLFGTRESTGAIYEITLGERTFNTPTKLHEIRTEWVGGLAASADRIVYSELVTRSRARVIGVDREHSREFEPTELSAAFGWTAAGEVVVWSRSAGVEIRPVLGAPTAPLRVSIAGEPQNTTFAGKLLIVSARGFSGRAITAFDLSSPDAAASPRWQLPEGVAWLVRCASDLAPPCVVATPVPDSTEMELHPFDATTGTIGTQVLHRGVFDDVAVHRDGKRMLIARSQPYGAPSSTALLIGDGEPHAIDIPLVTIRSIAYANDDIIVGGTIGGNRYRVSRIDKIGTSVIDETAAELLTNVRPSPDGKSLSLIGRQTTAELWELRLD